MNGVEILNKIEVFKDVGDSKLAFLIGALVCILIVFYLSDSYLGIKEFVCVICVGLIVGGICGAFSFALTVHQVPTGTYQYQIIISDKINFNEFIEKYNIVKQEGKIYTVEEKLS